MQVVALEFGDDALASSRDDEGVIGVGRLWVSAVNVPAATGNPAWLTVVEPLVPACCYNNRLPTAPVVTCGGSNALHRPNVCLHYYLQVDGSYMYTLPDPCEPLLVRRDIAQSPMPASHDTDELARIRHS